MGKQFNPDPVMELAAIYWLSREWIDTQIGSYAERELRQRCIAACRRVVELADREQQQKEE